MKALIRFFKNAFVISTMSQEEYYLSQSESSEDLERRICEISRGDAPFQKQGFIQNHM
jgi:hypothetical protein